MQPANTMKGVVRPANHFKTFEFEAPGLNEVVKINVYHAYSEYLTLYPAETNIIIAKLNCDYKHHTYTCS